MSNRSLRILLIMILDTMIVAFAGIVSLVVRFEFNIANIPPEYMNRWLLSLPFQIILTLLVFYFTKLYHFVWHYINSNDVVKMFVVITCLEFVVVLIYSIVGGRWGYDYLPKTVCR